MRFGAAEPHAPGERGHDAEPAAPLGAVMLTGYMGGAIATHVRISEPFLMQLGIGVVIWAGLYLRDARLRELSPLRR